jgi:hemoglobin/transferrin/lactoferrin receptor protein
MERCREFLPVVKANFHRQWNQRRFDTFSATLVPGARPVATERSVFSDADLEVDDGVLQLDWTPHAEHYIVSGLQYTEERVNQERHVDTVANGIPGRPENIHDEAAIETVALFVQDEWRPASAPRSRSARASTGSRAGSRRRTARAWPRRRTTRSDHEPGSATSSQTTWCCAQTSRRGYVYPSLLQFATGAYAASRFVNPNPDLDPETALSGRRTAPARRGLGVRRRRVPHRVRGLHRLTSSAHRSTAACPRATRST